MSDALVCCKTYDGFSLHAPNASAEEWPLWSGAKAPTSTQIKAAWAELRRRTKRAGKSFDFEPSDRLVYEYQ